MQAALDIANAGFKVVLVEKTPSVGGRMLQLSEVFPTLDCPQCIGTPKMVEVGSHPNIRLLAYSEVTDVRGSAGDFRVRVKKKTRYIDTPKCTACGECTRVCPVYMPNERDLGLSYRKAAYIPFAQAVPAKYVIDKRELRPCKAACKAACPISTNVQGYLRLIASGKPQEAYELIHRTNPLPSVCGRVCYSPCEPACNRGQIDAPLSIRALKRFASDAVKIEDLAVPQIAANGQKVAIVGSGPAGLAAANDLALLGYAVTIFEALSEPGGMLRVGIPEYRLPKDILRQEIGYIQRLGVEIRTGLELGKQVNLADLRQGYSAVFLATGAHLGQRLNIEGEDSPGVIPAVKFLREVNLGQKVDPGRRLAVIGGGNSAIDAARVAKRLGAESVKIIYRRSRQEMPAAVSEVESAESEGIEILFLTNPAKLLLSGGKVSGIRCLRMKLGEPDESGRRLPLPLENSQFNIEIDTVITALGQAPDLDYARGAGLQTDEKGNLKVDSSTLATNVPGVFAGGDAVGGPAMVISAIAAGKQAARSIDCYLKGEGIVPGPAKREPESLSDVELAGIKIKFPLRDQVRMTEVEPRERVRNFQEVEKGFSAAEARREAGRCLASQIEGCFDCGECERVCDPGAIDHNLKEEFEELNVGTVVVATGYEVFDARLKPEYGYGIYPNVITGLELERLDEAGGPTQGKIEINGKEPRNIVFIQCIGSRDKSVGVEYCSRVCCMYTAKQALYIKSKLPQARVTVCYIDIRAFGKGYEQFYERAQGEGVVYRRGLVSEVYQRGGRLIVRGEDTLLGEGYEEEADLVVLAVGLRPGKDTVELARKLNITVGADGFFLEAHPKLGPVETTTDGIYLAGCCQGPKDIVDSISQGHAAAVKAAIPLLLGKVKKQPLVASIEAEVCSGCRLCENSCEFSALVFDERKKIMTVNEALCRGCGACSVVCPSGANQLKNYTKKQVFEMISALV